MTAADGLITLPNHGFSNRDPVIFTGNGSIAQGLLPDTAYFVTDRTTNTFKVASSPGGAALPLTKDSSGSLTANKLVIYYTHTSTITWLEPNTINRSIRPCSTNPDTNCPALVDSIADNGLTVTITDSRQVTLNLIGQISAPSDPVVKLEVATTTVSTRNTQ
jgi:hypothetical protein